MKVGVFHFFLFLLLICLFLENFFDPLRYLKYLLPPMVLILFSFFDKIKINSKYFFYFNTFFIFYISLAIYLLLKLLLFDELPARFFSNAAFILFPLIFIFFLGSFFKIEHANSYVKFSFFVIILIFLFKEGPNLFLVLTHFDLLKEAVLSSKINTENQAAFVLGFFLFYFLTERYPMKYILLAAFVFILSFKRIALGAFLVSYLFFVISRYFHFDPVKNKNKVIFAALVLNFLFIKLIFGIVNKDFDKLIQKYTHFSANRFLMGRQHIYETLIDKVGNISWSGIGLGKVDEILFDKFQESINLHSDILKNYFQFGLILFVIWIFLLYQRTSFSRKALSVLIYVNVLMLTDNVFIYFDFMFYFYFFILIYLSETYYNANKVI